MRIQRILLLVSVCALLGMAATRALAITFSTPNFPGAKYTSLQAIEGDRIVGYYEDDMNQTHGFLRDGGVWLQLDVPFEEKHGTRALGISGDRIVGSYFPGPRGFAFEGGFGGGAWTPLDYPGSTTGAVNAVDGGRVVGTSDFGAYLFDGVTWTPLAYPGSLFTSALGVEGDRVVGFYQIDDFAGPRRGFIYDAGMWQPLDYPGSAQTEIYGIDGPRLVGSWSDGNQSHGFIYDGAIWRSFDYPNSTGTIAFGISGDQIVGTYFDETGNSHTFLATIPEPASATLSLIGFALLRQLRGRRSRRGAR